LVVEWRRRVKCVCYFYTRAHTLKKKKKIAPVLRVVVVTRRYQSRFDLRLRAPAVTGSIHHELEKVKFLEFFGAPDGAAAEAWLENMAMCFALHDYTSNMKVLMVVFQLKGSALLWWKTLLP
jgi:hypothetical protein